MNPETIATGIQIAAALHGATESRPSAATAAPWLANNLVGENVLIRTVTAIVTGHVEAIDSELIELSSAAWIADTGRFADALSSGFGGNAEIEPYAAPVWVQRSSVVDMTTWNHDLPTRQQ